MVRYGILLIGHGSRLEYNKQLTEDVNEGLDEMRQESIDVLIVLPFLLSGGVHVLQNIPRLIGLECGKKTGTFTLNNGKEIPLVYAKPLGADPLLAELLMKNADDAVQSINM